MSLNLSLTYFTASYSLFCSVASYTPQFLLSARLLGFRALKWARSQLGSVFPVPLLPVNSLRKNPHWAAALSRVPPQLLKWRSSWRVLCGKAKTGVQLWCQKLLSLISIASRRALGTPGTLNKARLWQWGRSELSRDQTNHSLHAVAFMPWDSALGVLVCNLQFPDVWMKPPIISHVNDASGVLVFN